MERVCFVGRVGAERLEEYRERHERVWPEMLAALREADWGNYSLYLTEDGLLIGYLETDDYQAALDRMAKTEVMSDGRRRWRLSSPS
jgi:L-rhamnose mutarotase